jgi:hypothetical protein
MSNVTSASPSYEAQIDEIIGSRFVPAKRPRKCYSTANIAAIGGTDMVKAVVATPSGTKVTIEGTDDEVVALVACLETLGKGVSPRSRSVSSGRLGAQQKSKPTLVGLISELIGGGYFKEPKQLSALKRTLEEGGQFYPLTSLSPALLRLVRTRQLRRLKDSRGRWTYVG